MQLIPAIDLRGGRCVRLVKGEREREIVYSENPVEVALQWQAGGASRLHMVDLDGAFEGKPVNHELIRDIARSVNIPVQLGGGLRDKVSVHNAFQAGVSRVILGTVAVEHPSLVEELVDLYEKRITVGIDARDGMVAVRGWVEGSALSAMNMALEMERRGVAEIIYTDISRDGTLEGPNTEAIKTMARSLEIPIIASGGVSSIKDLLALKELEKWGVSGVIVGQALYSGRFTLEEALAALEKTA